MYIVCARVCRRSKRSSSSSIPLFLCLILLKKKSIQFFPIISFTTKANPSSSLLSLVKDDDGVLNCFCFEWYSHHVFSL